MSFTLPVPKYAFRSLTDISPEFLVRIGVDFLMMDLDNTIAPYSQKVPSDEILQWARNVSDSGALLYIVSNNPHTERVEKFAEALGADYVNAACKPSPDGVLRAIDIAERHAESSALVGDQIFTDTLAANAAGVVSIIVPPISIKNPIFALRYAFELPFRALCKNKQWSNEK